MCVLIWSVILVNFMNRGQSEEGRVGCRIPNLIILQTLPTNPLQPRQLLQYILALFPDNLGPVEPHGVVGWVHADDVFGEGEGALGVLVRGHHCAEIRHRGCVARAVGDGGEGWARTGAVVEGNGRYA